MKTIEVPRINIIIAYFLTYVVWGSTYYFISIVLQGLPAFLLGAIRFAIAGLLLLGWCWYQGEPVFRKKLIKKSVVAGLLLLFVDMAAIMLAQKYVSSSFVAIFVSSTALWIMVLDVPMWRTNFRNPLKVFGVLIGFIGVALLYIEQLKAGEVDESRQMGVLILFVGCFSWALGSLYTKYQSATEEVVNGFAGSAWQMISTSAVFWLCAIFNKDITNTDFQSISVNVWLALAYLIVFGSMLAYSAYVWLLKVRPATEVATHAYVNPFVAVFIGVVFGNEQVSFTQIIGLIIILFSVMLISKKRKIQHT